MRERTFLTLHPSEWEALGVWVTAAITVLLLLFAYYQLRDARSLRIEQARPVVIVDVAFREFLIKLAITNTGQTSARDVLVRFDEPPTSVEFDLEWLRSKPFIEGIPVLAPGRTFEYMLDSFPARDKAGLPTLISGNVSYKGPESIHGAEYSERFIIDLEVHRHRLRPDKSLHDLVQATSQISKELQRWRGAGGRGLAVQVTDADRKNEREWRETVINLTARRREQMGTRKALAHVLREWRQRRGLARY